MTNEMTERTERATVVWRDRGMGYFSGIGRAFALVAYVALPENHPAMNAEYDDFDIDVNGGLTFADGNVFGWDYAHGRNTYDVEGDINRALTFFMEMV